ncbi:EF-Tu C-terminal domain-related protein [Streptomyces triculaminicus]|uniref:EF-Tu C-terminal domain-related protein n=1 Tax=Streptomyces triculaminicus TaxID=2816232 RepID=UPI0037B9756A
MDESMIDGGDGGGARAEVYVLPEDDGGRDVTFARREAQFYFRTTDVTGRITVLRQGGQDIDVSRGGPAFLSVRPAEQIAIEKGVRFSIQEAGKAVCGGVVTAILR